MSNPFLQIIIFIIIIIKIESFEAQLTIVVDDYLENVRIDSRNKNLGNYQTNEIKEYDSKVEVEYGSKVEITLSNYDGEYGLSAKLVFFNGKENEIYSTNDSFLWKVNDSRCDNNYPIYKDYTCNNISNSYKIGATDNRPQNYYDVRFTYYTFTLNIYGYAFCKNTNNNRNIKPDEYYFIDFENLIFTKLQSKNGFKVKFEHTGTLGTLYDSNNQKVQKNILYDIYNLKYKIQFTSLSSHIEYHIVYDSYISPKCRVEKIFSVVV